MSETNCILFDIFFFAYFFLPCRELRKNEQQKLEEEQKREAATRMAQRYVRGFLDRQLFKRFICEELDKVIMRNEPAPAIQVYKIASLFVKYCSIESGKRKEEHRDQLELLCKYLVKSLESESPKISYIGVFLNKDLSLEWIKHIKTLLYKVTVMMQLLRPEIYRDSLQLASCLHCLVAFTSVNTWVILRTKSLANLKAIFSNLCCNIMGDLVQKGFFLTLRSVLVRGTGSRGGTIAFSNVQLTAVITLCARILSSGEFSETLLIMFITQILTVSGVMHHVSNLEATFTLLIQKNILQKCVDILENDESFRFVSNTLKGSQFLGLLANLTTLLYLEEPETAKQLTYPKFTYLATTLLRHIPSSSKKQRSVTKYHELLGWLTNEDICADDGIDNVAIVKKQMHLLWSNRLVKIFFEDLQQLVVGYEEVEYLPSQSANILKKIVDRKERTNNKYRKIGSNEVTKIALICAMYHTAIVTLTQLRLDILSGLCYNDSVLHDMWLLIASFGPNCGLKMFLELQVRCTATSQTYPPAILMLLLFCDCMTHYITLLDDFEMYEKQNPFKLNDYVVLSHFLNTFLVKLVESHKEVLVDTKSALFVSIHTLLLSLYRRDCRRQFASKDHWLIRELKPSHFLNDLEKGKKTAELLIQKMPHIIPLEDRIHLFKKYVQNEKTSGLICTGSASALLTVHRDLIVEDGYRQMAQLSPQQIKGTIRVRFINQQGLDEAGIDQDGVFKEFLEECTKKIFDPSLNLFKATSEQRLYPSPTSSVNENHLQLFEFVGRLLGKAVYEGIVVDVPFASFFLSQVLGQTNQALYSCIDELPSLDNELYRSLTFIKHYEGDVADLDLTFSVDEDVMGKIITHELIPGGRTKAVSNDNKINYIHYMAYFRMHTQITEQTTAFIRGFRSIVSPEWLTLFSTPELQRLISGDTAPLDLRDLRKHTQYYGGFHDSHRVVVWLWDILAKDFTEEERKLFLKFVTSCSKSPLLGFAQLEPPFSIRCKLTFFLVNILLLIGHVTGVEVGDDEDTGDTIGSVIRGFFTIRKKDPLHRLPTSSTCFNLLKLPNYQKKATLREKLRYAITSNPGFELS